jgi:hypothetical protein
MDDAKVRTHKEGTGASEERQRMQYQTMIQQTATVTIPGPGIPSRRDYNS